MYVVKPCIMCIECLLFCVFSVLLCVCMCLFGNERIELEYLVCHCVRRPYQLYCKLRNIISLSFFMFSSPGFCVCFFQE